MILVSFIIVVITLKVATTQLLTHPTCDFIFSVLAGQNFVITNPEWPSDYNHDQICRWVLTCPTGYNCHLKCNYVSIPQTEDCDQDRILVSTVGDMLLFGADVYCGRTVIDTKSLGQRITIGLISGSSSIGGKFRCTVTPEIAA